MTAGKRKASQPLWQVAWDAFRHAEGHYADRTTWQAVAQAVARAVRRRDKAKPVPVPLGSDFGHRLSQPQAKSRGRR